MPADPIHQTTHKQVRVISRGDGQAIGLTLAGCEHVLTADEARDISRRLADAAFGISEAMALRLDLARLRGVLHEIANRADVDRGAAWAREQAREALADE